MKRLTTISLFIFWMVMTAILSASLFYYQSNKDNQKNNYLVSGINTNVASNTGSVVNSEAVSAIVVDKPLAIEELAKHNTAKDCWLLIEGKIYSVASYIIAHPGGAGTIIPTCGTDATQAYTTKNGNSPHSNSAHTLLAAYYIGDLNQQTTVEQVQQNVQTTNTITPPTTRGDDDEEEDDDD